MNRRRRLLRATGGLATGLLLAGCTEDDGDGSSSPTQSAREPPDSPAPSDATGTARSTVDGLALEGPAPFVADPQFGAEVTVTNTGDRETDALAYEYDLALTTGEGGEPGDGVMVSGDGSPEIAPGESLRLTVRRPVDGDPAAVSEYDLTLTCGATNEGTYCEN
ncbi:hypothetical protein [Haloglomus litoreum]|uniref:hypothetical protein n=1 Tax=Haloglomus litoreum TaxID=3034026 RepID=UPI0023E839A9|nr:hypothetical protein [Haloglomus sp. DT116]